MKRILYVPHAYRHSVHTDGRKQTRKALCLPSPRAAATALAVLGAAPCRPAAPIAPHLGAAAELGMAQPGANAVCPAHAARHGMLPTSNASSRGGIDWNRCMDFAVGGRRGRAAWRSVQPRPPRAACLSALVLLAAALSPSAGRAAALAESRAVRVAAGMTTAPSSGVGAGWDARVEELQERVLALVNFVDDYEFLVQSHVTGMYME